MSKKDNGGPAFPALERLDSPSHEYRAYSEGGMTMRDYLAAKAMQALLAKPESKLDIDGSVPGERLAGVCFMIADAMIAERSK